jgi:hypothetical protein
MHCNASTTHSIHCSCGSPLHLDQQSAIAVAQNTHALRVGSDASITFQTAQYMTSVKKPETLGMVGECYYYTNQTEYKYNNLKTI